MDVAGMNIGVNGWKTLAFKAMREKLLFSRKQVKNSYFQGNEGKNFCFQGNKEKNSCF